MYHAHIQPHIDYGLNIWGHSCPSQLDTVRKQQKKSLRIMNFKRKDHPTRKLFISSNILPLDDCIALSNVKLIWRIRHTDLDTDLTRILRPRVNSLNYVLPYRRTDMTQRCTSYHGVKTWNILPDNMLFILHAFLRATPALVYLLFSHTIFIIPALSYPF